MVRDPDGEAIGGREAPRELDVDVRVGVNLAWMSENLATLAASFAKLCTDTAIVPD